MSIHLQKKSLRCINNYPETVQTGENMGNEGQQLAPFSEMETEAKVILKKQKHPAHFKDHQGHYKNYKN